MKYRSKSRFTALLTAIAMIASNFTASSPVSRYVLNEINVSAADGAEGLQLPLRRRLLPQ